MVSTKTTTLLIGTLLGAAAAVQAANMRRADARLLQEEEAEMSIPSIETQGMLLWDEDEQVLLNHEGDATVCNKDGTLEVVSSTYRLYKLLFFKGGDLCKDELGTCEEYKCFSGWYKGHCAKGNAMSGSSCSDGDKCTTGDTCDGLGNCAGTPEDCSSETTSACEPSFSCDSATGTCKPNFATDGTPCGDGNGECVEEFLCNGAGVCDVPKIREGERCGDGNGECVEFFLCDGAGVCNVPKLFGEGKLCGGGNGVCVDFFLCNSAGGCAVPDFSGSEGRPCDGGNGVCVSGSCDPIPC